MFVAYCIGDYGAKHILCAGRGKTATRKMGLAIANEKHQPLGVVNRELVYIPYKLRHIEVYLVPQSDTD